MKYFPALIAMLVVLSGCTKLPSPEVILKQTVNSEYENKHDVRRTEVTANIPVMEIVIPFLRSQPDAPVLVLEATAQGSVSQSGLNDHRLDYQEGLFGAALSGEHGRLSGMADGDGFVVTAEGYHRLTHVIRLHGGVSHRNNWNAQDLAPHDRHKATRAYVGGEVALLSHVWVGAEYGVENTGSDSVKDEFMFRLSWR